MAFKRAFIANEFRHMENHEKLHLLDQIIQEINKEKRTVKVALKSGQFKLSELARNIIAELDGE